ncbi:MAG: MBL fold metallo-hydrolase [Planctomycetota bacterium]|nr:MBL fold metallo-hydrolase [Planctomycetota bacterium]
MSRRTGFSFALVGCIATVAVIGISLRTASGEEAGSKEVVRNLGGGHYAYMGMSNSGFFVSDEGILVVDALKSPRHAKALLAEIRKISDKPIVYLVNTHWHWDHTFGNGVFPEATKIYSTKACKERLEKDGPPKWETLSKETPDDYEGAELVIPEVTFVDEETLTIGGRKLLVKYIGRGHTDGDAVVVDAESRVIYAGDLLFNGVHPYMADGYSKDWIETLEALHALAQPEPEKWTVVPGHGEPTTPSLAKDIAEYIRVLRSEVKKALDAGTPEKEIPGSIKLPEKYADLKYPWFIEMSVGRIIKEMK